MAEPKLNAKDAPLTPADRPKPSLTRFLPIVNHYLRFSTLDLDPAQRDMRQTGEFSESTGPTHAINYLCWRRSGLRFNVVGVALITVIQLAQAVNVFTRPFDNGLIETWFGPDCPSYEEQAVAAVERCSAHCVNRSAIGLEALQRVVEARSVSLANSSLEAIEVWAAELANRTLANALLDRDLDGGGGTRGNRRRLECSAACSANSNAWTIKCAQAACNGCTECVEAPSPPPPSPSPPPASTSGCAASCSTDNRAWAVKCALSSCELCDACGQSPPPRPTPPPSLPLPPTRPLVAAAAELLSMSEEEVEEELMSRKHEAASELEQAMLQAGQGACLAGCLRIEAVVSSECAEAVAASVVAGLYKLDEDGMAALAQHCNGTNSTEDDNASPPPPPPLAEERYAVYQKLRAAVAMAADLAAFVLTVVAARKWTEPRVSMRLHFCAYLLLSCYPFIFAPLPWFNVLGLRQAIEDDRSLTYADSTSSEHAQAANEALEALQISADQINYRLKLAFDVAGSLFAFSFGLWPAAHKACQLWAILVPQLSLWRHGLRMLPYLNALTCLAGYAFYTQLFADPLITAFVLLSSTYLFSWSIFAGAINKAPAAAMGDVEADVANARRIMKRAQRFALAGLCLAYVPLTVYVVRWLVEMPCGVMDKVVHLSDDIVTADSVVLWTFQFYVGMYCAQLVATDVGAHLVLQLHADGWGKDKGWAGVDSVVARLDPDPAPRPEASKTVPSESVSESVQRV